MRFVMAMVAFIAAAAMVGLGIAQRTVWLEPDRVVVSAEVFDPAPYLVIGPELVAAHPGKQTFTIGGGDAIFLAYGRSDDVEAWIGDAPHTAVGYDAEEGAIVSRTVAAPAPPPPAVPDGEISPETGQAEDEAGDVALTGSPAGSDLWLDEFTSEGSLTITLDLPEDISIIVAADGTEPAPALITVAWPLENATPWAGPLLAGGALLFAAGLYLLVSGFVHHRRSRGPRRNPQNGAKRPKLPSAPKPKRHQVTGGHGRRAIGSPRIALIPIALVSALALSACSADYWPSVDEIVAPPTPVVTTMADEDEVVDEVRPPAVTVPQLERIMRNIAGVAATADEERDAEALETRFAGPALAVREANYAIRESLGDYAPPSPIPASPWTATLPEQTTSWPRVVMTISVDEEDKTIAPMVVVLIQDAPRENYRVHYTLALAPDAVVPPVAPAAVGATILAPDSKFLVIQPDQLAAAYGDVLMNDAESEYAELFEAEGDLLREQLGVAGQQDVAANLPETASVAFSQAVGGGPTIALATNDSGALVTVELDMTETVTPNDGGTVGFGEGAPGGALSGFTENSAKGVQRVTGLQLLFYVPAIGSDDPIRLLGWSEGLIAASEVS